MFESKYQKRIFNAFGDDKNWFVLILAPFHDGLPNFQKRIQSTKPGLPSWF